MTKKKFSELPFDQYSRQEIVRQIIDTAIRPYAEKSVNSSKLRIIDLGGHKGHTQDFFPDDEVTILDVFDEEYPGYIKGDATRTKFKDDEFDVVVSFDTFEHIPSDRRGHFISEASRIARYAFVIAAPFDNSKHEVSFAENEANSLYKKLKEVDHPWLAEHISYGIPTINQTETYIRETRSNFVRVPTNSLRLWLMTQGIMFNSSLVAADIKEVVDVSRFYNTNLDVLEGSLEETYRQIYVGSQYDEILQSVKREHSASSKTNRTTLEYISIVNQAYATIIKRLVSDREYLQQREIHLQGKHDEVARDKEILKKENNNLQVLIDEKKYTSSEKLSNYLKRFKKNS